MVGKLVDPLEDRLERTLRLTNQQASMHAWLSDRYGLSWQIMLGRRADVGQAICPFLLFVGERHGQAEEAAVRSHDPLAGSR